MKKNILVGVVFVLLSACATSQNKGAPTWTVKGAGAFSDNGKRVFYGVGVAPATIGDESLRRETADNRARADVQKVFSTSIEGSMTSYTTNDSERVERVLKTFQNGKISWVQIVDRYQAKDGSIYSLAKVDLDQI